jgi:phosphatidylglycerol:prolipoprotein diacylglycerol transferase
MHPILATFSSGGTEVVLRAYGTFYTLAWVAAVALATVIAWRRGFSWWRALVTFAAALAVGVVGARMLDLAVNWGYYAEDPGRVYDLGFRGFALYGGLILALVTGALLARAFRLPLWRLADGSVPALALGIVLMRTGCFLNGCCFGTVTSLPWGVTFPAGSPAWAWQIASGETGLLGFAGLVDPVHPTQLYEMAAAIVLGGLSVWLLLRRNRRGRSRSADAAPQTPSGVPFLAFALGFTLFRLGDHFLRAQLPTVSTPVWFYPVLYVLVCVGVTALLIWRIRLSRPTSGSGQGGHRIDG